MAPFELDGNTLGDKHRYYNKYLKEALIKNSLDDIPGDSTGDIKNLLEIDFANRNEDVERVIKAFQSTDSLYSSKAIKRCTWLIKEEKYAHIINPEYLHTKLYPQMTKKAFNKLMQKIRLTLKDEKRVEQFYKYEKERDAETAFKWLQYCSLPFVIKVVEEYGNDIPDKLLERLFRRSFSVFETYVKENDDTWKIMQKSKFLLNVETEKYLNILKTQSEYARPRFTAKNTKVIMKNSPHVILNNLEYFSDQIHLPTLAKYIEYDKISEILNDAKISKDWMTFNKLRYFIRHMPQKDKFLTIKSIFIDKDAKQINKEQKLNSFWPYVIKDAYFDIDTYRWYIFAPFAVAFNDLTKLIKTESSPGSRIKILSVLMDCARRDPQNVKTLLQYLREKHINEPPIVKTQFIDLLMKKTDYHRYDEQTWKILNDFFLSIGVYEEQGKNIQKYIDYLIIYNAIHNIDIPKVIENKFIFSTFKFYTSRLDNSEKEKVFNYLYRIMSQRIEKQQIKNEYGFKTTLELLQNLFSLLHEWNKDLNDYPAAFGKLKELILVKETNGWDSDLTMFYNFKKSWKRNMFEESLILNPSVEVCLNALKYDPELLIRYDSKVEQIRSNDSISMREVLNKLRIYWPQSIAANWRHAYLKRLDNNPKSNCKSLVEGLIVLLEIDQLRDIIKKYAPKVATIDYHKDDLLNLRKNIANKLHLARPAIDIDDILLYAKGDYIQYALPSLISIIDNTKRVQSNTDLMKLIHGPIALQKVGIRYALLKINADELTTLFMGIWKTTNKSSIRKVLFTTTLQMLIKERNILIGHTILELLCTFIENLTDEEDKVIYNKLSDVDKLPTFARGKFYEKSYSFLKALPPKANCEGILIQLIKSSVEIMQYLDPEFVENHLLDGVCDTFHIQYCDLSCYIIVSFLLCCKDEKMQLQRYDNVLQPLLNKHIKSWNTAHNGTKFVKINFTNLFSHLICRVWNSMAVDDVIIPDKLFNRIYLALSSASAITVEENFRLLAMWKLVAALMKVLNENSTRKEIDPTDKTHSKQMTRHRTYGYNTKIWNDYFVTCIPAFVREWTKYLKEDIQKYDSSVFCLYKQILSDLFLINFYISHTDLMEIIRYIMLESDNCVQCYLLAIHLCPDHFYDDKEKNKFKELETIVLGHPSSIVKMHFHDKYFHKETCRN